MTIELAAFGISFAVTMLLAPPVIAWLRRLKVGQVIQADGPQAHQAKAGTPTMGGLVILAGILAGAAYIACLERLSPTGPFGRFVAVLLLLLAYGAIGAVDDWLTIRPRDGARGIGSRPKFLLQLAAAVVFVAWLQADGSLRSVVTMGRWFEVDLGPAYGPLAVLFIVGMANFINITDGLDGLAAGLAVILALAMVAVPGLLRGGDGYFPFALLLFAIAGACAGFLWFNASPAKVFMGDTGSLAIGAAIPAIAIMLKIEIPMIVAGMVFILDGLSSAIQWAVFKYTRITTGTGKRVFKMSPIHHHFELSGWPEQLVVVRFWILGGAFGLLMLLLMALNLRW